MGKPISQEKQNKIFKLYKEGKTSTFIARQVESDWRTVKKYLEKNSLQKKSLTHQQKGESPAPRVVGTALSCGQRQLFVLH